MKPNKVGIAVIALAVGVAFGAAMWVAWSQHTYQAEWRGYPMMGGPTAWWAGGQGCPMMGTPAGGRQIYNVSNANLADYVRRATGLEVLEVEKYQYNYYVIVGRSGKPLQELLVFPNGAIHPEPQSMMWLGQPIYIDNATALAIAKKWLDTYFPGAEVEEVYTFPGYYTVHFTTSDGDMQMISISGYNGAVIFHKWHGKHIQ